MKTAYLLRALCLALGFAFAAGAAPVMAQQPFVIVPDTPGGGGGGGVGSAVTVSTLNVRAGPGTSYPVVHVLGRNERVDIVRCSGGWCFVDSRGPSGWVSRNYLNETGGRPPSGGGGGSGGGLDINIGIGIGGPTIDIGFRRVCFFDQANFRGRSFCARPGESDNNLGGWNNRIMSINVQGIGTSAQVCINRNFTNCSTIRRDTPVLNRSLQNNISSFRVR